MMLLKQLNKALKYYKYLSYIDYLKIDQNARPVTVLPMHYTY